MDESNPELESFREQWRAEVSAKGRKESRKQPVVNPPRQPRKHAFAGIASSTSVTLPEDNEDIEAKPASSLGTSRISDIQHGESSKSAALKEPRSALEHYEKAVEREAQGNLGDSLDLYRKAFRMDHQVDKAYKNKHFPITAFPSKPPQVNPSNAPVTVPNTAHHSLHGPPQNTSDLISSFSALKIKPSPPAIEGTDPLPCPISELPEEILIHILADLAVQDVGSFVRLSQVCKRLAYLISTEDRIWRRVCVGSEVGFGGMHYVWQRDVLGKELNQEESSEPEDCDGILDAESTPSMDKEEVTHSLLSTAYSTWFQMFRQRPRIRFNGCYISTVNYIRAGQASQSQVTWSSPVHIVTYFRYLRFFRDGTVISLLTTTEPADVVHHLTKELEETHRGGAAAYLPSQFMQHALRGRWRLSNLTDNPEATLKDAEGDVFVETEGPNEKYLYRMKLSLRSTGKGPRNNKLVWQGFWSYNMLTDDTGEFTLRNDKAFYFSRVKSYGIGA